MKKDTAILLLVVFVVAAIVIYATPAKNGSGGLNGFFGKQKTAGQTTPGGLLNGLGLSSGGLLNGLGSTNQPNPVSPGGVVVPNPQDHPVKSTGGGDIWGSLGGALVDVFGNIDFGGNGAGDSPGSNPVDNTTIGYTDYNKGANGEPLDTSGYAPDLPVDANGNPLDTSGVNPDISTGSEYTGGGDYGGGYDYGGSSNDFSGDLSGQTGII